MSKRGCLLWLAMAGVALLFVWAKISLPLEELGTIQHLGSDGTTVKTNSIATLVMIFILCIFAVVAAVMLIRADKKASDDVLLAPVAKVGCGKTFAWLCLLALGGFLAMVFSLATGGS